MATKATYTRGGSSTVEMDSLFVTVMDHRKKEIVDQIFKADPELAYMLDRKDTECLSEGGEQFLVPMEVEENPNGGMIDEEEGVSMDDYDPLTSAIYDAKTAAYGLRWSRKHQRVNAGSSMITKLIVAKEKNTVKTMRKTLRQQLWNGSGVGKQMTGIKILIPATATASQSVTVGGVSPSTYAWWRTQAINMTGLIPAAVLEANMNKMYNLIADEVGAPHVIFCDRAVQEIYEENCRDHLISNPTKIGDFTFEMVKFKGMPIICGSKEDAPAGEMRFIHNDFIKFCVDDRYWFEWDEWKGIPNVPFTKVKQLIVVGNLARSGARGLGCIYNISTT